MMRTMQIAVAALGVVLGTAVTSQAVITDNLQDGPDAVFNFDFNAAAGIQGPGATGSDFTGFSDFNDAYVGLEPGLFLAADQVEITFNLGAGQFISFFEIDGEDFVDAPAGTNIRFIGADAGNNPVDVTVPINSSGPFTVSSSAQGLAQVDIVVIDSFEGTFETIDYEIVPEPTAAMLLGVGALGLLRRRRA